MEVNMVKIALDVMGGDFAPQAPLQAVKMVLNNMQDVELILFGDEEVIQKQLETDELRRVTIVHATQKVTGDDEPVKVIRKKKQSSMVLAATAVKNGEADVLLSAGNTGALLASGLLVIGRMKGIDRPGLMPILPTANKAHPHLILMDAGANADCKPPQLLQFAILANFYAQHVLNIEKPRIGLINNGTEETKGNELAKETFTLLSNQSDIHFVGNVETKTLLDGEVDIAVTDGFTGNAVLKTLEGTSKTLFNLIKDALLNSGLKAKIGALLIKDALRDLKENFDDTKQGGAILLGVKAPVIKAHGSSNALAIYNAVKQAQKVHDANIISKAANYFENRIDEV